VQLDLAVLGLDTVGKNFTAVELEPNAKPDERGAGELKAEAAGSTLSVTVPVLSRNFRLFKVGR
jgi:hypothetical protein